MMDIGDLSPSYQDETIVLELQETGTEVLQDETTVLELRETGTEVLPSPKSTPGSSKSVVEIFAETIRNSKHKQLPQTPTKKIVKTRIKPDRYGEVLTSKEVIERLQKAELEKQMKEKIKKEKQEKRNIKVNEASKRKKSTKETKPSKITKRNLKFESSDSDTSDVEITDKEMFHYIESPLPLEEPDEVEYEQVSNENLKPGKHILVNVLGGYRKTVNYKYVCCIQSVLGLEEEDDFDDDDSETKIKVMGLRRVDEHATTFFPDELDIFVISKTQILGVLPDPKITEKDRKLMFVFPGSVAVFEKA
ncbi:uncharacterized protein LOC111046933 [Nilaparvata lugens]|uniref:uncharacterized protein LOC111046933 n=1 Tax=Nilaparvata lugens TaxID=108931 RepID=UPI00193D0840|nr:uncharacterized protein LOC111046933 [Nilaparvata lugens]